jgi:excisionase family DNA binding protein
MTERYVDAAELATTLGVSRSTVKRWVAAGCPSRTWGLRVRRFRVSEVEGWLHGADTLHETNHRPLAQQRHRARPSGDL